MSRPVPQGREFPSKSVAGAPSREPHSQRSCSSSGSARSETACVNGIGFPWIDEEAYGSSRPAICYYAPDENGELRIVALEWVMLVEAPTAAT